MNLEFVFCLLNVFKYYLYGTIWNKNISQLYLQSPTLSFSACELVNVCFVVLIVYVFKNFEPPLVYHDRSCGAFNTLFVLVELQVDAFTV